MGSVVMQKAFSLIELVVVLVIIGLIVGGITSGQNLIRSAQLQSVITDIKKYESAVAAFQERYFQLPGDMDNATTFWGAAHTTAATCRTTASTGTETCNGDGDGKIEYVSTGSNEMFRVWQHLANAGLIEGSFSGVAGASGNADSVIGTNVPAARISSAGYSLFWRETAGDGNWYAMEGGNHLFFGSDYLGDPNSSYNVGKALTPEEAWNVDKKIDDGKPVPIIGKMFTLKPVFNGALNCTTSSATTATYNVSNSAIACPLIYDMQM
jgi:prepilin-type N-terminal cleavage/methylation domain-containing protein